MCDDIIDGLITGMPLRGIIDLRTPGNSGQAHLLAPEIEPVETIACGIAAELRCAGSRASVAAMAADGAGLTGLLSAATAAASGKNQGQRCGSKQA